MSINDTGYTINLPLKTITEYAKIAYIYGFAPVTLAEKTYNQTHPTKAESVYAPINELYIDSNMPQPGSALWVTPNVNVVYSSSHMDLSEQPMILYVPAGSETTQDPYFVWQFMDAYSNDFHYLGTRATEGAEGTYMIVGPDYKGETPSFVPKNNVITSPTNSVWLVGRHEVQPGSTSDREKIVSILQHSIFLPLNLYQDKIIDKNDPNYLNPLLANAPTPVDVDPLDVSGFNFFYVLNQWLLENPPPLPQDQPTLNETSQIGVSNQAALQIDNFTLLPQDQQKALLAGIDEGHAILEEQTFDTGYFFNGWDYNLGPEFGNYGTDYLLRSLVARGGLGANMNVEAVYPVRFFDANKEPLNGGSENKYSITFPEVQSIPVNSKGFWSITLYSLTTGQLISNSINRYCIGSQDFSGKTGSVTIYIQSDNPGGDKQDYWLPSPTSANERFYLIFRAYYPEPDFYQPWPPNSPDHAPVPHYNGPTYILPNFNPNS